MEIGMLWYASDGKIVENILKAADYYESKHGSRPNQCFVSLHDLAETMSASVDDPMLLGEFLIGSSPLIAKWHIWIGEDGKG